jgi:O-antigen ligase
VRPSVHRSLLRGAFVLLAVAMTLPLVSLFEHPDASHGMQLLSVAMLVVAAVHPPTSAIATIVLLPLTIVLEFLTGMPGAASTEVLVFAFTAGAAWRAAVRLPAPARLARPALVLGAAVVTSAIVGLVHEQASQPGLDLMRELAHHVTHEYLFGERPFLALHESVRWIAALGLAVAMERAVAAAGRLRAACVRMWLVAGAGAASFAAQRLWQLLLEGKISQNRWATLRYIFERVRISALHPDPNAAGSYFVLLLVAAVLLGLWRRSIWTLAIVCPLLLVAFALAQSRAAIAAALAVWGLAAFAALMRRGRRGATIAAAAAVVIVAAGLWRATSPSHGTMRAATAIRTEMTRVAVEIIGRDPMFGVGVGEYVTASRRFIDDRVPTLRHFAPHGENAHDNFLQIAAELGIPALLAFLWLVLPQVWPGGGGDAEIAPERRALSAGIAAFLLSAIFGHPLLIAQVLAAFFLALGLRAGLSAPRERTGRLDLVAIAGVALFVVTLPLRLPALLFQTASRRSATNARTISTPTAMLIPMTVWRTSLRSRASASTSGTSGSM